MFFTNRTTLPLLNIIRARCVYKKILQKVHVPCSRVFQFYASPDFPKTQNPHPMGKPKTGKPADRRMTKMQKAERRAFPKKEEKRKMSKTTRVRPTTLRFHVSEEEKKMLKEKMLDAHSLSMDEYLRTRILTEAEPPRGDMDRKVFLINSGIFYEQTGQALDNLALELETVLAKVRELRKDATLYLSDYRNLIEKA